MKGNSNNQVHPTTTTSHHDGIAGLHKSGVIKIASADGKGRARWANKVNNGQAIRLLPGCFIRTSLWSGAKPWERFRYLCIAASLKYSTRFLTLDAAASLHGIPLIRTPRRIVLGSANSKRSQSTPTHDPLVRVDLRRRTVPGGEVVVVDGFATTSLPWTAAAVAGRAIAGPNADYGTALVALEGALRNLSPTGNIKQAILDCVAKMHRGRAAATINQLVNLADSRSDSPAESLMRLVLFELGFIDHKQQVIIGDDHGNFIARVDFMLIAYNIVIEVDGEGKYNGTFGDPFEQLNRERRRHNATTNLGYQVIRISWKQLQSGEAKQLIMNAVNAPNSTSRTIRGTRRLAEKIRTMSEYGKEEIRWTNMP